MEAPPRPSEDGVAPVGQQFEIVSTSNVIMRQNSRDPFRKQPSDRRVIVTGESKTWNTVSDIRGRLAAVNVKVSNASASPQLNMHLLRNQLISYTKMRGLFSYSVYLKSAKIRMAYYCLCACCVVSIGILSYEYEVLFDIALFDISNNSLSELVAKVIFAPIILTLGAWILDEIVDLIPDALSTEFLLQSRSLMVAFFTTLWNWKNISYKEETVGDTVNIVYSGPEISVFTMRLVEVFVPVIFELVPLSYGFTVYGVTGQFKYGIVGYISGGIWFALLYGIVFTCLHLLSKIIKRFRAAHLHFASTTPVMIESYDMGALQSSNDYLKICRVLNPWRYICPEKVWSSNPGSRQSLYERLFSFLDQISLKLIKKKIHPSIRLCLWLSLFCIFASLVSNKSVSIMVGWSFMVIFLYLCGLEVQNNIIVLGNTYSTFLILFVIGAFISIASLDVVTMTNDTSLDIVPPQNNAGNFTSQSSVTGYPICKPSWNGLSTLDLALHSDLSYAFDSNTLSQKANEAFLNTSLQDWKLIHRSEASYKFAGFNHIYHPLVDVHVISICVRSDDRGVFQQGYLIAATTMFEFVSKFVPLKSLLSDSSIQDLMLRTSLQELSDDNIDEAVDYYISNLVPRPNNIILTGHSVGGSVAQIISARREIVSLTFAAPGVYFNSKRFDIKPLQQANFITNVSPDNDLVGHLGITYGNTQTVTCTSLFTISCHELKNLICELQSSCGDQRGRDFKNMCK